MSFERGAFWEFASDAVRRAATLREAFPERLLGAESGVNLPDFDANGERA